jgi:CRISPR/Cas system CMR-associated protein Cmr5 small subunit
MGDTLESNVVGKEVDTKQWEGAFRQVILAHEACSVILKNRLRISEAFKKAKNGVTDWSEFHSLISQFYSVSLSTHSGYDYGLTTSQLREASSDIQKIFKQYNA